MPVVPITAAIKAASDELIDAQIAVEREWNTEAQARRFLLAMIETPSVSTAMRDAVQTVLDRKEERR